MRYTISLPSSGHHTSSPLRQNWQRTPKPWVHWLEYLLSCRRSCHSPVSKQRKMTEKPSKALSRYFGIIDLQHIGLFVWAFLIYFQESGQFSYGSSASAEMCPSLSTIYKKYIYMCTYILIPTSFWNQVIMHSGYNKKLTLLK